MAGLAEFIENADRFLIPDRPRLAGDLDWMARARCQGQMALFFSDGHHDREAAKALCLRCPVLSECANWRDRVRPKHGIWAGAGAGAERQAKRRLRAAEQAPEPAP